MQLDRYGCEIVQTLFHFKNGIHHWVILLFVIHAVYLVQPTWWKLHYLAALIGIIIVSYVIQMESLVHRLGGWLNHVMRDPWEIFKGNMGTDWPLIIGEILYLLVVLGLLARSQQVLWRAAGYEANPVGIRMYAVITSLIILVAGYYAFETRSIEKKRVEETAQKISKTKGD